MLLLASVLALEDRVREVRADVDELPVRHGAQSARTATCTPQHKLPVFVPAARFYMVKPRFLVNEKPQFGARVIVFSHWNLMATWSAKCGSNWWMETGKR